ncbi:MAG: hypothetical protein ACI9YB_002027, partial [Halioglobus sp.]
MWIRPRRNVRGGRGEEGGKRDAKAAKEDRRRKRRGEERRGEERRGEERRGV